MVVRQTAIKDCFEIEISSIKDERGWFARTFCKETFDNLGITETDFVQMNHSYTSEVGSIRGLHLQRPPYAEEKLIRCIVGAVFDVVVDCRKDSDSYLKWIGLELTSTNQKMLYVPKGCAHGFQTLLPNTELIYMHTSPYSADSELGFRFDDTALGIDWPLPPKSLSQRDLNHPLIQL